MSDQKDYIEVRSSVPAKADGGQQVVLSEKNPNHPDGHGFVSAPDKWTQVYKTAQVGTLIANGTLIERGSNADDGTVGDNPQPDAGESNNAGGNQSNDAPETFEIMDGDTPEKIAERYKKETLSAEAKRLNIKTVVKDSELTIAEKILAAQY